MRSHSRTPIHLKGQCRRASCRLVIQIVVIAGRHPCDDKQSQMCTKQTWALFVSAAARGASCAPSVHVLILSGCCSNTLAAATAVPRCCCCFRPLPVMPGMLITS
eukprot:GHUV01041631.1.p1 GENE.GHUV01041631.1~~GHUV01041631.1.p1  ORF type:complete len:105 (-),score=11.81 GHUV01041631.1:255-569(-)